MAPNAFLCRLWPLALLACGCGHAASVEPAPPIQPEAASSAASRWQNAAPARASAWLEAPAKVLSSPNDAALVSVPLGARVVRVRVHQGQVVEASEPLVDVVMPQLIQAAGALRSAELRLASWQERRTRVAGLLAKGLALAADLSEIEGNIASVRGDRENARATLRAAGESDRRALALLDGDGVVSLRAPIAGVVTHLSTQIGETREPAQGPLLELVSRDADTRVEARFSVLPPEGAAFEWLEAGRTIPLALESISPHADERDGSRSAWLRAAEDAPALVAGTLGRVRLIAGDDWVVVPAAALREQGGGAVVEVKTAQGSERMPVTVIQRSASEAVVRGIPANALVASDALAASADATAL